MKFDAERALTLTQRFDFPRHAGTEGERRAADLVAEEFERAGLSVERRAVPPRRLPDALIFGTLAMWFGFVIGRVFAGWSPAVGFGAAVLVLGSLIATGWVRRRSDRAAPGRSENVLGTRPGEAEAPVRVLFLAPLDTPPPVRVVLARRGVLALFAALAAVLVAPGLTDETGLRRVAGPIVLLGHWVSVVSWIVAPRVRARGPSPGDHRSGLAALAELARGWTRGAGARIETRFGALGDSARHQAGARALARDMAHWPAKPTLVIHLDAPGLGPTLRLVGRARTLSLAQEAARDLWIPHRASSWIGRSLGHEPFRGRETWGVSLCGERRVARIDPAALAAAAQLATEIALRWARQRRAADQDESRARSSQKPG
ncbi:MAG TPA: aminopeptidase [Isosphaeraceae bacterium]|jgi:hypothetical protein